MKNTIRHIILWTLLTVIVFLGMPATAKANVAGSSAAIIAYEEQTADTRVEVLRAYLMAKNSPLATHAQDFITTADTYNLDYRLVAAISGVESSFGLRIPYNSYNGWGWGVYGDNVLRFNSWDHGIDTISAGLRTNYMDKWGAETVYEIGDYYAADEKWATKVTFFMNQMEAFETNYKNKSLSISI